MFDAFRCGFLSDGLENTRSRYSHLDKLDKSIQPINNSRNSNNTILLKLGEYFFIKMNSLALFSLLFHVWQKKRCVFSPFFLSSQILSESRTNNWWLGKWNQFTLGTNVRAQKKFWVNQFTAKMKKIEQHREKINKRDDQIKLEVLKCAYVKTLYSLIFPYFH